MRAGLPLDTGRCCLALCLALLGMQSAQGQSLPGTAPELWAFIDAQGVAHFAPHQRDGRYRLLMGQNTRMAGVPGKADHQQALLTWLAFAPEVRAVQPFVDEAARLTGLDAELLQAMIAVESGYKADVVSPRGASGLMQIMPEAAQRYASSNTPSNAPGLEARLLDPRSNVLIGARMLADLIRRFGRIDVALAAWNAGEGAVRRAGGRMPAIDETQAHVHLVLELYWALLQRKLPGLARSMQVHAGDKPH